MGSSKVGVPCWCSATTPCPQSHHVPYTSSLVKCITVSFAFMPFSQFGSGVKSNIWDLGSMLYGFPQEHQVPFTLPSFSPALPGGAVSHLWRATQCLGEGGSVLVGFWVAHLVTAPGQGCPVSVAGSDLRQSYLLTDSFSLTTTHTFSLI